MKTSKIQGIEIPALIYGTAWKENRTAELTKAALVAGFRAIDTANQRKHYVEAEVGQALGATALPREDVFLQTKFTYVRGQDHRLPYDASADVGTQVQQSFATSLAHLGTDYIDSYLLHGPESHQGWSAKDRQVWRTMEALHREKRVRLLGVSNIGVKQLEILCGEANVVPAFVQNRCYARDGWDQPVREFCEQHAILYQGFSLLTANSRELAQTAIVSIASRLNLTVPQLVFRFANTLGIIALTGTSSSRHMREDLASLQTELLPDDLRIIANIAKTGN